MEGLTKRNIWTACNKSEVIPGSISMRGPFILTLKNYDTPEEKKKVRFDGRGYDDLDKPFILHDTSILQSSSLELILLAVVYNRFRLFFHEGTQAYLHSKQRLARDIYNKVRTEDRPVFGNKSDEMLHLNRTLYGLYDAGDYWRLTITDHSVK